jgi:hypothetical protein
MLRILTSLRKRAQGDYTVQRPTALTLARHILAAVISDGMLWVVIPVLAVTAFLYTHHFHNDLLLALMFLGLVMIALVRGCRKWQNDLDEYQRHLALERQQKPGRTSTAIPGYYPSRRY